MHETSWQIELHIREGRLDDFKVLMEQRVGAALDEDPPAHGYVWSLDDGQMTAVIAKIAAKGSIPVVTWSADWPTARHAFKQVSPTFAADLLAVAEPVNLVTFGDGELEADDDVVIDVSPVVRGATGRSRALRKRVAVHGQASLQLANG